MAEHMVATCDVCGAQSPDPLHWPHLTLARPGYDGEVAVMDGTIKRLLCDECSARVDAALEKPHG